MYTDNVLQNTPVEGPPTQLSPKDTSMDGFQMPVATKVL